MRSRQCSFQEVGLGGGTAGGWQELALPLCRGVGSQPAARASPAGLSPPCGELASGGWFEIDKQEAKGSHGENQAAFVSSWQLAKP